MATIEVKGNIIARMEGSQVQEIYFCVGIPRAGSAVDFSPSSENISPVVISYSDRQHYLPTVNWTVERLAEVNDDYLLDYNELFQITVLIPNTETSVSVRTTSSPSNSSRRMARRLSSRERYPQVSQYVNLH